MQSSTLLHFKFLFDHIHFYVFPVKFQASCIKYHRLREPGVTNMTPVRGIYFASSHKGMPVKSYPRISLAFLPPLLRVNREQKYWGHGQHTQDGPGCAQSGMTYIY